MVLNNNFQAANVRAREVQKTFPRAIFAHYDPTSGQIVIQLSSKLTLSFSPRDAEGLAGAADGGTSLGGESGIGSPSEWVAGVTGGVVSRLVKWLTAAALSVRPAASLSPGSTAAA